MKSISVVLPEGFQPEGVALALFDERVLAFIEQAIPVFGKQVLAHLLHHATLDPRSSIQQSAFPVAEERGVAIILIVSIAALAKSTDSPCAPETYHKILLTLEALGIIQRIFHRRCTEIRIPWAGRILPTSTLLSSLRTMHTTYRNKKFQRFAERVAKRITTSDSLRTIPSDDAPLTPAQTLITEIATVLGNLLHEYGVQQVPSERLHTACQRIAQVLQHQNGRITVVAGDSVARLGDGHASTPVTTGDSVAHTGASLGTDSPVVPATTRYRTTQRGDSVAAQETGQGQRGDSFILRGESVPEGSPRVVTTRGRNRPNQSNQGLGIASCATESPKSEQTGESPDTHAAYKDSRPMKEIRRDAADLAELLDGSRSSRWFANLITCVQRFPPDVRRLAVIDTVYHSAFPDDRGRPKVPGGWFAARCKDYADPQYEMEAAIRQWNETDWDIASIHRAVQRGHKIPPASALPYNQEQQDSEAGQAEPAASAQRITSWQQERALTAHSLLNTSMDLQQAQALCAQVIREGAQYHIQAEVRPGQHAGEYVVISIWEDVQATWRNVAAWNRYFEEAQCCAALAQEDMQMTGGRR